VRPPPAPVAASIAINAAGTRIAWAYRHVDAFDSTGYDPDSVSVGGSDELHIESDISGGEDVAFGDAGGTSLLFDTYSYEEHTPAACNSGNEAPIEIVREDPGPGQNALGIYCVGGYNFTQPALSPDGQTFTAVAQLYNEGTYEPTAIVTVPISAAATASAGSDASIVVPSAANSYPSNPTWSPDGTQLAFAENHGIYTVPASGRKPQLLVSNAAGPAWSPYNLPAAALPKLTVTILANQSPIKHKRLLVTVGWSAACYMGAYAESKVGKAKPFEIDSNVYRLSKAGSENASLPLSRKQLSKLKAGLKSHKTIRATVNGVIVNDKAGDVNEVTSRGKSISIKR
jgi:hypothetical protein